MLAAVCIGSNDLKAAGGFYDEVLATLDMTRRITNDVELGYGTETGDVNFWVLTPYNRQTASVGNGVQVTFAAPGLSGVDAFHATALRLGGSDEGAPGPRDYEPGYYGAYCRDPEGNKLHVCYIPD